VRGCIRLAFSIVVMLVACNGDEPHRVHYEGTPGQAIPLDLDGWVPVVQTKVNGGGSFTALVDTGSPLTAFSPAALPGSSPGEADLRVEAFGLVFPDFRSVVVELFEDSDLCQPARPMGLFGGDLLRGFRLGLDYRGEQVFLFDSDISEPGPVGKDTEAAVEVPISVAGGGIAKLGGLPSPVTVGATRVLVADAQVEGTGRSAIVDTGASLTVLSSKLFDALGGAGRPVLCCESVATLYGIQNARITRLKELRLGQAVVKNLPVLIWDNQAFFESISSEVGRDVSMLIGGSFLRRFAVEVDYRDEQLLLQRYRNQDHVDKDEFVGPGFTLCRAKQAAEGVVVVDVYKGSSAEKAGVKSGEHLIMVDGQAIAGMTLEEVRALLARPEGTTVNLIFAGYVKRSVTVERLLKDYN
jgi:predicted aspartyl protease